MRYHDDIIAVFKSRPPLRFFAHSFRNKRCAVFKYTCAGVYSTAQQGSFTFLDLEIHVVHPQLKIGVSQCKPLVPLSPCSAHHLIVHTSWPKVVANRTYILSGRDPSQLAILSERLRNACAHNFTVAQLKHWRPKNGMSGGSSQPDERMLAPLVLRFHPLFAQAFSATAAKVPVPSDINVIVMPSWKNSLPCLASVLSKHSNKKSCRDKCNREGVCFLFSSSSSSSTIEYTNTHGFKLGSIARNLNS